MEPYYYSRMDKEKQAAYRAMEQGLRNLKDVIALPRIPGPDLAQVFMDLRLDHPEIFWTFGYHYRYYPDSPNLEFLPEYLFDKDRIREQQKAMSARIQKLTRPAQNLSEWEKERYIHDFICTNVRYDKLKKPYSHEIIGPLGHGVGVCEGIAKTVKILCQALGIWCMIPICGSNPEKGIKYGHTWNIVKIQGACYHLDATFDNTLTRKKTGEQTVRYDYFNLDDKRIFLDHEPLVRPAVPCTDGNHFYYREKKLSFTKPDEVYGRARQAAKKGKTLVFNWRGGHLNREMLRKLLDLMEQAGREKDKTARVSLNRAQAVFCVSYTSEKVLPCLVEEQANEEEDSGNSERELQDAGSLDIMEHEMKDRRREYEGF